MRRIEAAFIAAAALAASAGAARAGGTPENALVVINPANPDSMHVGNYYCAARDVPPSNVLYLDPGVTFYTEFRESRLPALFGTLENARIADHIDYVVVTPTFYAMEAPNLVKDACFPVQFFSMSAAFTLAFISDEIIAAGGMMPYNTGNRYYQSVADPNQTRYFDSSIKYLSGAPSSSPNARQYFIGAMLGYTGPLGNSVDEILDMIDRSVAVDGTLAPAVAPGQAGTFYFMNNTSDPARNVRATQFAAVVTTITSLGGKALKLDGVLPVGKQDCQGIMTGAATLDLVGAGLKIMPGAFCDHLTSWAATFDIAAQTKVSEWIRHGASGSWGAVQEPCNYVGKFPHARMHQFYWQGLSLGEAVFRSVLYAPFQMLLYGDPLTRPFAYLPDVDVPDAPAAPVGGTVPLTVTASTQHPTAGIQSVELLVAGRSLGTKPPGTTFLIDTTRLSDGWHDLRALAYENTLIRSVGRWVGGLTVDNLGRSASVQAAPLSGDLATPFVFNLASVGGASEIRLIQNHRVLAASAGAAATLTVHGRMLGAGPVRVQAEALFPDGRLVRSAPLDLSVSPSAGTPAGAGPIAYSFTKRVLDHAPFVVELPATMDDAASMFYAVLSGPAQATVLPGYQPGPWRVMKPAPTASGADSFTFQVFNAAGASNVAVVTLVYDACPDLNGDAFVDQADLGAFLPAYGSCEGDPLYSVAADFNQNGCIDQSDLGALLALYEKPCP